MAESHLSHEDFFAGLTELFAARQDKDYGRVYLTQKRLTYGQEGSSSASSPTPDQLMDLSPAEPLPIIIRATNGKGKKTRDKKVKLSTVVKPVDIEPFFQRYSELCKTGMRSLKKRDRKAKKKGQAKKKKTAAEGPSKTS